ncbi:hypothetical protein DSECCO2_637280 [anaerobic digester metagenome]
MMPFSGPSAAAFRVARSSSVVVGFSSSATKSTMDTVAVGTRRLMPSNLPFISGMTLATALAAPVEVGMMFCAAARARRRSLWGRSRMRWSLVYECTVVSTPLTMPKALCSARVTGARQLVVHEALDTTWCFSGS